MGKPYIHFRHVKATGGWAEPGWAACTALVRPDRTTKDRGEVTCPKCKKERVYLVGYRPRRRTV